MVTYTIRFAERNCNSTTAFGQHLRGHGLRLHILYVDDKVVYWKDEGQHKTDLSKLLQRLHDNDLKILIDKSVIFLNKINYLRYAVNKDIIRPWSNKLHTIKHFPEPKPHKISAILPRTNKLLSSSHSIYCKHRPAKHFPNTFQRKKAAYNKIKETLSATTAHHHPFPSVTHLHLGTDSSLYVIGAALPRVVDEQPIPLGFLSKNLSASQ